MPNYDFQCTACDHVFEGFVSLAEYPKTLSCEKCDSPTVKVHLPRAARVPPPAVVLYKCPDGTFRFPGDDSPHSRTAQMYAGLGYERIEARGWPEVRRIEGLVGQQQASEIRRRVERQCALHEQGSAERRSEIRRSLEQGFQIPETDDRGRYTGRVKTVRMTEEAKGLLRAAMDRNDRKPGPKAYESGFHVEVYSQDRGNREDARRADGKRHRD